MVWGRAVLSVEGLRSRVVLRKRQWCKWCSGSWDQLFHLQVCRNSRHSGVVCMRGGETAVWPITYQRPHHSYFAFLHGKVILSLLQALRM